MKPAILIFLVAMMAAQEQKRQQKPQQKSAAAPAAVCNVDAFGHPTHDAIPSRGPSYVAADPDGTCPRMLPPAQMEAVKAEDGRVLYCRNVAPPQKPMPCNQPKAQSKSK